MNLLRFAGKLLSAVWECIILGLVIGAFYGLIEGALFGVACVFTIRLEGGGNSGNIGEIIFYGAAGGAYFGVMQGAGCGALAGAIIGARHWALSDGFKPLYRALRVGARAALIGGSVGAFNGVIATHTIWEESDSIFIGFLPGSVIGWCSCFVIGALWAGVTSQRPRAVAPPLEAVLRWLWGEKRRAKLREP